MNENKILGALRCRETDDRRCAECSFGYGGNEVYMCDELRLSTDAAELIESLMAYRVQEHFRGIAKKHFPYPYNLLACMGDMPKELDADRMHGLTHALSTLTEREQQLIQQYYEDGLTLEDCGKLHHVTRERIREILAKAVRKLCHPSRRRYITDGYAIASGELEREYRGRLDAEYARLRAIYDAKIAELQAAIDNPVLPPPPVNPALEDMELSVRSYNVLKRARKDTLDDVAAMTVDELTHVRNLGRKSLQEIIEKVHAYGKQMKDEVDV